MDKAKKVEKGLQLYSDDKLFKELKKRSKAGYDVYTPDHNLYDQLVEDLKDEAVASLQEELDARNEQYQALKLELQKLHQPNLEDKV